MCFFDYGLLTIDFFNKGTTTPCSCHPATKRKDLSFIKPGNKCRLWQLLLGGCESRFIRRIFGGTFQTVLTCFTWFWLGKLRPSSQQLHGCGCIKLSSLEHLDNALSRLRFELTILYLHSFWNISL